MEKHDFVEHYTHCTMDAISDYYTDFDPPYVLSALSELLSSHVTELIENEQYSEIKKAVFVVTKLMVLVCRLGYYDSEIKKEKP